MFYDNSILPGTKIAVRVALYFARFYDNSILPGTKIYNMLKRFDAEFYDNSILPGTKIKWAAQFKKLGFTITQFFQVLKSF